MPALALSIPTAAYAAAPVPARLIIPSIGFSKPIVEGWTREIDQGKITKIGECWPDQPRTRGLPCSTTWIAGHHTTHGAPFRTLCRVRVGDTVIITAHGKTFTYRITSKGSFFRASPPMWVFRQDLLLQTSDGSARAWVLSGTLVSK
jgi:sortase (surface protein transpeptidase)